MDTKEAINNKTIMVTGGTGSFGNCFVERLLRDFNSKEVIVFSRDEKKQLDMRNRFEDDRLKFIIGDVREKDVVYRAMKGVDLVFHAAALKQVPTGEFFPIEMISTNILGAYNVINAAADNNVKKVVVLSTDKAVYPINVMGMTKALMERLMIADSRNKRNKTIFCGTRYGNVMYTRGSVIPFFIQLIKKNRPLTITDSGMTRFMLFLKDSIDLVLYAMANGENGEIFVKKAPVATVGNIAQSLIELFDYKKGIEEMGIRPGEKMHETLISREELFRTKDVGDFYKVSPEVPGVDYRKYYFEGIGGKNGLPEEGYKSSNAKRLSLEETKEMLLSLDEVKEELS